MWSTTSTQSAGATEDETIEALRACFDDNHDKLGLQAALEICFSPNRFGDAPLELKSAGDFGPFVHVLSKREGFTDTFKRFRALANYEDKEGSIEHWFELEGTDLIVNWYAIVGMFKYLLPSRDVLQSHNSQDFRYGYYFLDAEEFFDFLAETWNKVSREIPVQVVAERQRVASGSHILAALVTEQTPKGDPILGERFRYAVDFGTARAVDPINEVYERYKRQPLRTQPKVRHLGRTAPVQTVVGKEWVRHFTDYVMIAVQRGLWNPENRPEQAQDLRNFFWISYPTTEGEFNRDLIAAKRGGC